MRIPATKERLCDSQGWIAISHDCEKEKQHPKGTTDGGALKKTSLGSTPFSKPLNLNGYFSLNDKANREKQKTEKNGQKQAARPKSWQRFMRGQRRISIAH